jgi:hypothetical protein
MRAQGARHRRIVAASVEEAERQAEELTREWEEGRRAPGEKLPPAFRAAARRGDLPGGAARSAETTGGAGRPYLYVIDSQKGTQKIGISKLPEQRMRALETASGRRLELWLLIGGRQSHARWLERMAHEYLAPWRREGEWFQVTPVEAIAAVARALATLMKEQGARRENVTGTSSDVGRPLVQL